MGELHAPRGYVGLVPIVGLAAPGSVTPLPFPVVINRRSAPQDAICPKSQGGRRSTSVSDDDDGTIEALWSTDDCRVSVEMRGDIRFTANEDGVEFMEPRSFLGIDQRIDGLRRELEVAPGDQGRPEYAYRVNGDTTPKRRHGSRRCCLSCSGKRGTTQRPGSDGSSPRAAFQRSWRR
jgi:hypothetical protein